MALFRDDPVTSSLLPRKRGPKKGTRQLDASLEAQIAAAIEQVYLRRERPSIKRVMGEVRRTCRAAGLAPPSMKALRARISSVSLRDRVKAREGAAQAGDQFRQVRGGLRTMRPLHVVQIDHTKVDVMLVDDVTRACIGRPWLTLVLNVHTRVVLGLHLSLDAQALRRQRWPWRRLYCRRPTGWRTVGSTAPGRRTAWPKLFMSTTAASFTRGRSSVAVSSTASKSRIDRRRRRASAATSSG